MAKVLVITASPRAERSASRALTMQFVQNWVQRNPGETVLLRDLGHHPVPHVTEPWVAGSFGGPEAQTPESRAAIAVSDQLLDEFLSCEKFIFGVPMHNLSVPSTLKAYIDQIVRAGRTFALGPHGYEGLVKNRKALFILTSGGAFGLGTPAGAMNFQEPYLRAIFGFIGLTDVRFITADSLNLGADAASHAREMAEGALRELAQTW